MGGDIFIGGGGENYAEPQTLLLSHSNRHGLIAGATGTGKTVTLQIMAEGFSAAGVPVFMADVKGDLSGLAVAGSPEFKLHEPFMTRARTIGLDLVYQAFPVTFWDLFGQQGHPIRTTVSEMGPLLLSRLLDLSDVQEGVLNVAFRVADEEGLPLLDLQDLQALLVWVGQNADRPVAALWQCRHRFGGRDPAAVAGAGKPGRHRAVRRAGAVAAGPDGARARRARPGQHPCRRSADGLAPALRDLPAVAVVGAVRGTARGRQPRQAQAGVLLRRGASAVQRCAQGAGGQGRAGGPPDPLQGGGGVLRHPEPRRRARKRAGTAGQPGPARAARLHRQGPQGSAGRPPRPIATIRVSTPPTPSARSAPARPSPRCWTARACRRWSSAR